MKIKQVIAVATPAVFGCAITSAAQSQVQIDGAVVTVTVPTQAGSALTQPDQASPGIDFENAQPMPLPVASTPHPPEFRPRPRLYPSFLAHLGASQATQVTE